MSRYKRVPAVNTITGSMVEQNIVKTFEDIINDHIPFRTMGIDRGNNLLKKYFYILDINDEIK